MAGVPLWRGVRDRLWAGMPTSSADHAVFVDTHPFEGSVAEMNMRAAFAPGSKAPQEMTIMPVWAPTDLEGSPNPFIGEFLMTYARIIDYTYYELI